MARFFIDRPIFAWVIAIVIMGLGVLSINRLPVSQYPAIASPAVVVNAMYPGASAETVTNTVVQVIEKEMTGLDGLRYINSSTTSSGMATITLTFELGTDPDIAQVQVQNKLSQAQAALPQAVTRQGVTVQKSMTGFLLVVALYSPDGSKTDIQLSDYLNSYMVENFSRLPGVGSVQVFGSEYAMRIWLDPKKLQSYDLSPGEVVAAVQGQNAQISAGTFGAMPAPAGQLLNATITAQSLLKTPQDFESVIIRADADGGLVMLRDVARVELGTESYEMASYFNGMSATGMAVQLASGANALETAAMIKERLSELEPFLPEGMEYVIPYDTTPFVSISIEAVIHTLVEAIVLVFLVMLIFLHNLRATLIPTMAVPVVLLGTFGIMAALGFSINTLTMLAMVLAIGLLVDYAIVVVAIIFTPALCATMLKPHSEKSATAARYAKFFEPRFTRLANGYGGIVKFVLNNPLKAMIVYAICVAAAIGMYRATPTSFLPDEDQGVLMTIIQGPSGATAEQTRKVLHEVEQYYMQAEGNNAEAVFSVRGFFFAGQGQNMAMMFVRLKDWEDRVASEDAAAAIAGRAFRPLFGGITEALVIPIVPPAVMGLGNSNGFTGFLQARSGQTHEELLEARNMLLGMAAQSDKLQGVRPNGIEDATQMRLNIDWAKAGVVGLTAADVGAFLNTVWSYPYINDFLCEGRVKRVYVQGSPAPGVSSDEAMAEMERLAAQLPPGFSLQW